MDIARDTLLWLSSGGRALGGAYEGSIRIARARGVGMVGGDEVRVCYTIDNREDGVHDHYEVALGEARRGSEEGGIPIGAVLVRGDTVVGAGHNKRVQDGDPTAHAEIDCLRNAGRVSGYRDCTLYTTLTPCHLCTGAILLFGIRTVVIGEITTFDGDGTLQLLRSHGVVTHILDDDRARQLIESYAVENPDIWAEDIGK